MPVTVQIDGVGKVQLDDSFKSLSPADQQSTVDEIANQHASPAPAAPAGPQPTALDRVVGSPLGRLAHDYILSPLSAVESALGSQKNLIGPGNVPKTMLGPVLQQDAARAEGSYQGSLAANRNTPGYAAERAKADMVANSAPNATLGGMPIPSLHGGFTDAVTAPFNSALAGTVGLAGGLDASNAAADAQAAKQQTYSQQHPILSTGASVVGGLATGAPTEALASAAAAPSIAKQAVPTIADLNTAKKAAYAAVDNSPMKIAQPEVQALYDKAKASLEKMGLNEDTLGSLAPKTSTALDSLAAAAKSDQTLQGMEIQRRIAGIAAGAPDKTDRAAARIIQDHIDDFVGNLQPSQLSGPIDQAAIDALPQARDLAKRSFKAQQIQSVIDKAGVNGSNFSASGYENALRSGFRKMANNDRAMARFSPAEQDAIRRVATGGSPLSANNLLRQVGKLSPQGALPMALEMGAVLGGVPHAAIVPVAGLAGRIGATALTKNAAQNALDLALLGKTALPTTSAAMLNLPRITAQSRLPLGLAPSLLPRMQPAQ